MTAALLAGCSEIPAASPRYVSTDALAFIAEVWQERVTEAVAAGALDNGLTSWVLDDQAVATGQLVDIDVATIHMVAIDAREGIVRLYTDKDVHVASEYTTMEVFSPRGVTTLGGAVRTNRTLYWLGDVVLSGEDMIALGARRANLERRLQDIVIWRPQAVARVVGAETDVTVVVGGSDYDIFSLVR